MTGEHRAPPHADSQFARQHPAGYLSAYAIAGAIAVILFVALFLLIGHAIPTPDALTRGDLAVNRWMESHGTEPGETIFTWVSYIGAPLLAAIVVITLVAFARRRDWFHARAVALVVIGAIGFSRVYLGVHFVTDVVGGWLAGAAWLIVGIGGYRFAQRRVILS